MMRILNEMSIKKIILPFMLVFTIVYAVLTNVLTGMFGGDKKKKRFASIIALVIGLSVVIPHATGSYPPGMDVVEIMLKALPNVALVAVGIIGLFIFMGLFGFNMDLTKGSLMTVLLVLSIGGIAFIFANAAGAVGQGMPSWLGWITHPDTLALLIVIAVFTIVIKVITGGDDEDSNQSTGDKFKDFMNNIDQIVRGGPGSS